MWLLVFDWLATPAIARHIGLLLKRLCPTRGQISEIWPQNGLSGNPALQYVSTALASVPLLLAKGVSFTGQHHEH